MATWQYDIHFIPRGIVDEQPDLARALVASEELDTSPWWIHYDHVQGLVEALSTLLPATVSWSDSIQMWGTYDGDRIEVSWSGVRIEDVHVRFDVRQLAESFMQGIVEVAKEFKLLILTENMHVIEPNYQGLLTSVRASSAAQFVKDPTAFLSGLDRRRS
jgi:hypothetical protein